MFLTLSHFYHGYCVIIQQPLLVEGYYDFIIIVVHDDVYSTEILLILWVQIKACSPYYTLNFFTRTGHKKSILWSHNNKSHGIYLCEEANSEIVTCKALEFTKSGNIYTQF